MGLTIHLMGRMSGPICDEARCTRNLNAGREPLLVTEGLHCMVFSWQAALSVSNPTLVTALPMSALAGTLPPAEGL